MKAILKRFVAEKSVTGGTAVWLIAFVRSMITDDRHTPVIENIVTPQ